MAIDIKIPSVGESVQEAVLAEWFKKDGDIVQKDEALLVIETDKVTLEVVAEAGGVLKILIKDGETVAIGAVVGRIETAGAAATAAAPEQPPPRRPNRQGNLRQSTPAPPETKADLHRAAPVIPAPAGSEKDTPVQKSTMDDIPLSPSVRRLVAEKNLDVSKISGTGPGNRISKGDVLLYLEEAPAGIPENSDGTGL